MTEKFSLFTVGDLELAITNLIEKRLLFLQKSKIGLGYEASLRKRLVLLKNLPNDLKGGRPVADRLEEADLEHDGYIDVLLSTTNGALSDPGAPQEQKRAAVKIMESLKLRGADKKEDYPTEASTAHRRTETITSLEAELKQFPLSGGRTLFDIAKAYLAVGQRLDELLNERAEANALPKQDRAIQREMRPSIIGMLNSLRTSLAYEIADNESLPRDLDAQIFSYFDELHRSRVSLNRDRAETKEKAKAKQSPPAEDPKS